MPVPCPLCEASLTHEVFRVRGYGVRDCSSCGHRFAAQLRETAPEPWTSLGAGTTVESHVKQHYGDDYFFGGGAGYANYLEEGPLLRRSGQRYAKLLERWTGRPGTVLDVGAAAGFQLLGWQDRGWTVLGVEPNPTMADYARTHNRVPVATGTWEHFHPSSPRDVISMIQVMAHWIDPREALRQAWNSLRPGGWLVLETWDYTSLTARLWGSAWHEYNPPSVLHWWSPQRLRDLARELNFQPRGQGYAKKFLSIHHAMSLLRHQYPDGIPGRLLRWIQSKLPKEGTLLYPADDVFWMVWQKRPAAGQN